MGALPREQGGVASGLLSVTRTIGQISGVTLAGAIWSAQVAASAGHAFADITQAPTPALVDGFQTALMVAACIALVALIPALLRRNSVASSSV